MSEVNLLYVNIVTQYAFQFFKMYIILIFIVYLSCNGITNKNNFISIIDIEYNYTKTHIPTLLWLSKALPQCFVVH